jgi:hypothetical protein
MLSRRQTLVTGVGTGAGAALGAVLGVTAPAGAAPAPLRRAAFAPLVGAVLTLSGPGGRHEVTLTAARGTEDVFSLRFATDGTVPEGIYRVGHPDLAPVDLFLTPTGPTRGRVEAVVNRSRA